ncbi:MAG TPA: hypothetical protein VLA44_09795 [Clostridia bacterium]|nr:hypothetical protein [Clostridia bacterium]
MTATNGTAAAEPAGAAPSPADTERPLDLVLARLHLRLGSLALARAELEGMAGSGSLDDDGVVDLAEARLRTGVLPGAGEAAGVALAAGSTAIVAYVIAAEATSAAGRPGEARRLASRALELSDMAVSEVFAGMPRGPIWPAEPSAMAVMEPLFDLAGGPHVEPIQSAGLPPITGPGLWEDAAESIDELPEPGVALEAGRAALEAGDQQAAALHLSLALRLAPGLAPIVLQLLERGDGPELSLVRGDAHRIAGHERDARLAFASVASAIPDRPIDKETS